MLIFTRYILVIGHFLFCSPIVTISNDITVHGKFSDLSVLSKMLRMFFNPDHMTQPSTLRAVEEAAVEKIVRKRLYKLKPFLQDNDFEIPDKEDRFTFEGNDETTIIEFLPQNDNGTATGLRSVNDTFKANMRKYKNTRNEIRKALDQESVSDKTKSLIMNTLDELISKMVETQCSWKGGEYYNTQSNVNRVTVPRAILNMWTIEWDKFKKKLSTLTNDKFSNMDNIMSILDNFNVIINDVSNNVDAAAKTYSIKCNVIPTDERGTPYQYRDAMKNGLYVEEFGRGENICEHFKLCSRELKGFFIRFYKSLNETTVNVLRSYGEMFTRDVHADGSNEKTSIVTVILDICDAIEKEIVKIYIKDTSQLELDKHKNIEANINILSEYIRTVIRHVKEEFKRIIQMELKKMTKNMYSSIERDITLNLDVDLGNVERDLIDNICYIFNVCNGKPRLRTDGLNKVHNAENEGRIHVQVELTLNDSRDSSESNSLRRADNKGNFVTVHNYSDTKTVKKLLKFDKYANITVTRTTRA